MAVGMFKLWCMANARCVYALKFVMACRLVRQCKSLGPLHSQPSTPFDFKLIISPGDCLCRQRCISWSTTCTIFVSWSADGTATLDLVFKTLRSNACDWNDVWPSARHCVLSPPCSWIFRPHSFLCLHCYGCLWHNGSRGDLHHRHW